MGAGTTAAALLDQFGRSFTMLRDAIQACPDEVWRTADIDWLAPARQVMHLIETAEFYAGSVPANEFPWGRRFGDWEGTPAERLPSRQAALTALDEVLPMVEAWLGGASDGDFLSPETLFPWTGGCVLSRALYLLRHQHHHQGILHAELRRRGIDRPTWR